MFLLTLSALSACTDLASRAEYLTGPEAFEWSDDGFTIDGKRKMAGDFLLSDGELDIWVRGFPPGTEIAAYGNSVTVDEEGYANLETPVGSAPYGSVPIADWNTGPLEGLKAQITPPGGAAFEIALPPSTVYFPGEELREAIVKGPVRYEGEGAEDGVIDTIYYYNGYDNLVLGGQAKTLSDFDAVAVVTRITQKEVICDGYEDDNGNAAGNVTLEVQDARVDVYGRRSGTKLATKTFPSANEDCPSMVFSFGDGHQKRPSDMPREEMEAWVKAQIPQG